MIKILKHLKLTEWLLILVCVGFLFAQTWLDLKLPDYMTDITRYVETPDSTMSQIWETGGKMLLCTLGSAVTSVIVGYFAARIAAGFSKRLRSKLFHRVEDFSMEEINGFSTASLITRSTNDITQIQMFIAMGLQIIIKAPILAVWAVAKISTKSWEWTALTGGAVAVLLVMIAAIMIYALPKFRKIQWLTDNLNRVTRENLTGIRVVRAYNAEKYEQAKFEVANSDITNNMLSVTRAMTVFNPGMTLVMSGITLGIYWIGAYLIDAAAGMDKIATFSNMVAFSGYAMQVIMAFMMLTITFIMAPRVQVSAKRINEVLDTKPRILDGKSTQSPADVAGEIEFRNVSFKYPDAEEYVLHDISFKARKGETVAFIGSTGSGKSTLINLVPRFYDVSEGQVLIDDVDVREYTQEALHNKIGYVPQRAVLFTGTVSSNIDFGDNGQELVIEGKSAGEVTEEDRKAAREAEIRRAVEIAQGAEFVEQMEDKYEAHISQGGTNVSGGQKQRLAIARAIYRKPEIYIFDDSFSALDYKTDRILRSALRKETSGVTSLIVAQRIGTIRDADRIIVLDEGNMVGMGTHDELMKNCEVYQQIAYSQLSKEELGA
ncbi:ATP-binding cassette, subfamily B [Sporobacter termitidis DSM 10068]|uniref:ATP-binding cassette, subfamily B n=1 Tax=Sporobacter termitidis DSM 10068 TaxID=1123282 RepID=A0A1M5U706_9FIRM|nr:ABC transporter ATP-binding protein [Sporobacter termitidis]SHH58744.1 ATP-binding cassette, subfamily B [Sporobacter termitidis DSM 10068]